MTAQNFNDDLTGNDPDLSKQEAILAILQQELIKRVKHKPILSARREFSFEFGEVGRDLMRN